MCRSQRSDGFISALISPRWLLQAANLRPELSQLLNQILSFIGRIFLDVVRNRVSVCTHVLVMTPVTELFTFISTYKAVASTCFMQEAITMLALP